MSETTGGMKPEEMQAGEAADARICEDWLGYRRYTSDEYEGESVLWPPDAPLREWWRPALDLPLVKSGRQLIWNPRPSEFHEPAFAAAEKAGLFDRFSLQKYPDGDWAITDWDGEVYGKAPTVPLAICRALKALKGQVA